MSTELSENGFEMLRCAVRVSKDAQARTADELKRRLLALWPARAADIDEALQFWANDIRNRHPQGPPR